MSEIKYREPTFSQFRHQMVGRDGNPYFADEGLVAAANAALALGRPLASNPELTFEKLARLIDRYTLSDH